MDIEKIGIDALLSFLTWSELPELLQEVYLRNKTEEGCAFSNKLTKKKVLLLFNTGFK